MKKNYQGVNKGYNLLALVILLFIFTGLTSKSNAQVGPGGVNSGVVTWVDASDINGNGNLTDEPADGATVATWYDKSGNGKNATTLAGKQSPTLQSDAASLMEGNPVLYFPGNSVYVFNGIDLRATALPNATIFTVYRHTAGAGTTTGLWGVDNGAWDRFIYTRFGSATNGIASQGPVAPVNTVITGSGTLDKIQLFTAVYTYNVAGASAFYLGGQLVGTFHDRSDPTAAQTNFRLGWDGDDGLFYGQIAELIVYNRKLTDCEILTVNKFLSEKYKQDFNNLSSNYNWPSPYNAEIAVIGMKSDACGATAYNQAASDLVTISNPTSNTTANEYLSIAHNSATILASTSELPADHKSRTAREWRVDEDGDLGNVDICFDVTGIGFAITQANAYSLLSDADGDFSNATVAATSSSLNGNVICFSGVNLANGQYYTIAEKKVAPIINTSSVNLPGIVEDVLSTDNTGTLISALISGTASDGNGDALGIAAVSRDATNGTWQFFESGIWKNFDLNGVASETLALLLPPTAQIRFIPASNYFGSATFTYRAWDQTSGTAFSTAITTTNGGATAYSSTTGTATVTVSAVNDAPVISSTATITVNEDAAYSYTIVAADVDAGNVLTYSAPVRPAWLTFNTTTHILSGTPTNSEVGIHNVTLRVNDGTVNVDQVFTITVANTNDAPTVTSTAVISVNEDAVYSYTITASDVDAGAVLTYTAPVLPAWLAFNTTTRLLSGTPTNTEVGAHNVTLRVNDGTVNTDQVFVITVANTNDAPTITSVPVTSVNEDVAYSYTIVASDVDAGNVLTYSATVLPSWLTFNTTTRLLAGTPTNNDVGTHNVTLRVNDGTVNTDQVFLVTVTNTNDAPTISSTAVTSVNEDMAYSYTIVASDVDAGNVLTYSAPVLPSWLTFNTITRLLSGTPTNNEVGTHPVTLRVSDGTVNVDQVFSITVTNTNDAPTISSVAVTTVNEDAAYSYTIVASDVDAGSVLGYSAPVLPSWLTFNTTTRLLSGTPTNNDVGTHAVTLRVNDGTVNTDQVFLVTVTNTNDAPTISSVAVTTVNEDAVYSYTIVASDVDAGNVLTYSAPVLPSWLTFNTTTRLLSGTPTNNEVGTHPVTLRVSDGTVNVDQVFSITVTNTNDAPTISSLAVTTVNEDAAYSYTIVASDVDAGSVLGYSAPVLPSWLTFNTTTRLLSGTPTNNDVGTHAVTLRVNDGTVNTDQAFSITVANTNDAPTISSVAVTSVNEDAAYSYTIVASDVDAGNVLTYSATVLPSWLTFNTTTRLLSGTPTNNEVGTHPVTLRVNDGIVAVDQTFTIAVTNTNDAPTIASVAVTAANEDAAYSYTFAASDVDAGATLVYTAPVLPAWLTFNTTTRLLSGTPTNSEVGTHNVTLRVNDGIVSADQAFVITVANTNDAPTITSVAVTSVNEDAAYLYTITASDVDAGAILSYTATVLPSWLTFNTTTALLSGTPSNSQVGTHNVTLRVNDGTVTVDQAFVITVSNTNDAPVISSVGVTSASEDAAYSYTIVASDVDAGNILDYSATVLPSWLTFNTTTRILSGTPTNNEVGAHPVTLRVNDGTVNVDQSFSIAVTNTNDAPTINSVAVTSVNEDVAYSYTIAASDIDAGNVLAYSAPLLPSWLTFNTTTKVLSGTPANNEVGTHNVTLRVSDGTVNVDQAFTISVTNTNDAPTMTSIAVTSVNEDATYSYTVTASDVDAGAVLTYSAPVLPAWLTFNTTTRVLSGTPTNNEVGTHAVTLRVNDGIVNADQAFSIMVINTNDAPTITSVPVTSVNEDALYSYTFSASDIDAGSVLTYGAHVLPSWLTFNPTTRVLSGTPTNSEVGSHNVTLRVSDGIKNVGHSFIVFVANTNDYPTVTSVAVTSVNEDAAYSYVITASDVDAGSVLTYSAPVLPAWLLFNTTTRILSGTPANNEVGVHNITLRVNDGIVSTDQAFSITVVNTNDAPLISSTAVTSVDEDVPYAYTISASDIDGGDVLTYSAPLLPAWLTFDGTTKLLSGTPVNSAVGTHNVTLRVNDGTVNVDQAFTITVVNTNDAPVITSTAVNSVEEDEVYTYTIIGTDADAGNTLTYSAPVLPVWLTFNTITRLLSGTPTNSDLGIHSVTLNVSDGTVDVDQTFLISVANANDDPTINSSAITTVDEDEMYSYIFAATDVDAADALTYSAPLLPDWLTFNATTGKLSGTPANDEVGTHNVTLRVSDGTADVDQLFTITVTNTNDTPNVNSTPATSVEEDASYMYTMTATDVDVNDILTYSAPVLPGWLSFNTTTGVLSGTPTNGNLGTHNVTLRANDGTVDEDQLFTITVINTNDLPVINSTAVTSVNEDNLYSYVFVSTDIDASDALTYSAHVLPSWLTFDTSTGILSGTPTNEEVGVYDVTLRVNDGTVNVDQIFTITVANTNDAPLVNSTALTSVDEDTDYSYFFGASDEDENDVLTFSAPELPAWLTFNAATGLLSGLPTNTEIGIYNIVLRVTDGTVDVDQTFTITVGNANDVPTISSIAGTSIEEDAVYSYTITATDMDATDILTYSATVLPQWLTFNTATHMLTGTPTNNEVGIHDITLRVSDGTTQVDQSFTITVSNTNDAPVLTSVVIIAAKENVSYSYTITATDVDANSVLVYASASLPVWLTFNSTTGVLQGTPTSANAGTHEITLSVSDGIISVEQVFTITVAPNIAPVIEANMNFSIDEQSVNGTEVGQVVASDEDGNIFMNWAIVSGNTENAFSIDTSTGLITVNNETVLDFVFHPSFTLVITVSDGFTTSLPVAVTISVNDLTESLRFYSAFSPNGEGANETWEIDGLEAYPDSHLKIFNSDGMVMFSNVGYTAQWDGFYKGKEMPLGTYYYIINLNDGTGKTLNGQFMIIK